MQEIAGSKYFSWLHLSDLHVGLAKQDWLWPNLKHQLFDDLKRVYSSSGCWDVVIFSGDVTQSGSRDEFDKLDEVLQELWSQFGSLGFTPKLIVLPGNHDISRPKNPSAELRLLKRWWSEEDLHQEIFSSEPNEYQSAVATVLKQYTDWEARLLDGSIPLVSKTTGVLPGDQSCVIDMPGGKIGVVGLNSTWLQLDGDDYEGKLHVDLRQLLGVTGGDPASWCARNTFNILVTHHPVGWLHPESQADWNSEINPPGRFDIHLYGHMHEAFSLSSSVAGSPIRTSYQAASIFGLSFVDGKTDRIHGYCVSRIDLSGRPSELRIWPRRLRRIQGGANKLGPDLTFDLDEGNSVALINPVPSASFAEQSGSTRSISLRVLGDDAASREILRKIVYHLPKYQAHSNVRKIEQASCLEHLNEIRAVWLISDWGIGEDGFISGIRQIRSETSKAIYRLDLSDYESRDQLSDSIKQNLDVGLDRFCELLANAGTVSLLLDNVNVGVGAATLPERDLEELVQIVLEYCPNATIFLRARRSPQNSLLPVVELKALDEADLRNYLLDHERGGPTVATAQAVSELHRYTEGIPARIDRALKELEVVPLADLLSNNSDFSVQSVTVTEVSPALRATILEFAQSPDPVLNRAFSLLKALSVFPQGEQLNRIRRFNSTSAFFPRHATELLDQGLIEVTSLQGPELRDLTVAAKTLVVPKPIRELVRELMDEAEKEELNRRAADMYFGPDWSRGIMKPPPAYRFDVPVSSGADIANASAIVIRLLKQAVALDDENGSARVLGLAYNFLGALTRGDHYRSGVTFCDDIFPLISIGSHDERAALLRATFARCLRMCGDHKRAKDVALQVVDYPLPIASRQSVLLNLALCHQSLKELDDARSVAEQIIKLDRHSAAGLQARSLLIELDIEDPQRETKLVRLEALCRRSDAQVVANNIALLRAQELPDDPDKARLILAPIVQNSRNTKDFYNATRAIVELAELSMDADEPINDADQLQLINAYHFVFNERFSSLFDRCHDALWKSFLDNGDRANLLILFRHSSLFWRLRGQEDREARYLRELRKVLGGAISQRSANLTREAAYYQSRAGTLITSKD